MKKRILNGYVLIEKPEHLDSNSDGSMYEHRLNKELALGRRLLNTEVVHHKNEIRDDNLDTNLMVFKSERDHRRHHNLPLEKQVLFSRGLSSWVCVGISKFHVCGRCGNSYKSERKNSNYCSTNCANKVKAHKRRLPRPSRQELHRLVWSKPSTALCKSLGCSDRAIGKWCIDYDIPKPPRGFWRKLETGTMEGQSCPIVINSG